MDHLFLGFGLCIAADRDETIQQAKDAFCGCIVEEINLEAIIDIQHLSKVYHLYDRPVDRLKEAFSMRHTAIWICSRRIYNIDILSCICRSKLLLYEEDVHRKAAGSSYL